MEIPLSPDRVTTRAASKRFIAEQRRAKQGRRTKSQRRNAPTAAAPMSEPEPEEITMEAALADLDACADAAIEKFVGMVEEYMAVNPHHSFEEAWAVLMAHFTDDSDTTADWTPHGTPGSSGESTPSMVHTPPDASYTGLRIQQEQPVAHGASTDPREPLNSEYTARWQEMRHELDRARATREQIWPTGKVYRVGYFHYYGPPCYAL